MFRSSKNYIHCFINHRYKNNFKGFIFFSNSVQQRGKEEKIFYILKRQDDNGNIFTVAKYPTFAQAQDFMKELTQNVHKQHYWIETNTAIDKKGD